MKTPKPQHSTEAAFHAAWMDRKRPPACEGCPLNPSSPGWSSRFGGGFVPPHGSKAADILTIGIAPGEAEEIRGVPLVGPSGRIYHAAIDWAAGEIKFKPKIRKLNLVQCRTVKPGVSKDRVNRDPTKHEISECRKRFLDPELARFKGRVIQTLGQLAEEIVFGLPFRHVLGNAFRATPAAPSAPAKKSTRARKPHIIQTQEVSKNAV